MDSPWFSATRAGLIGLILSSVLAGCGGVSVTDVVQLSGPRIAVMQFGDGAIQGLGGGGEVAVQVGQSKALPLRNHLTARIEGAWVVGPYRLALIGGSTKECARLETLLVAQGENGQLRPLGKCMERFATTLAGDVWTARQITARGASPRDQAVWIFQAGVLNGGQSALGSRRRPQQADRASESDRTPEADRANGTGANGTGIVAEPALAAPGVPPTAPIAPPPISRPVGDDVVPPPVGAGPLPGHPMPSPRLF